MIRQLFAAVLSDIYIITRFLFADDKKEDNKKSPVFTGDKTSVLYTIILPFLAALFRELIADPGTVSILEAAFSLSFFINSW